MQEASPSHVDDCDATVANAAPARVRRGVVLFVGLTRRALGRPRGCLGGLLHAWDAAHCSLCFGLRARPFENGLELRDQTSQTHSPYTQECVCEVCSRSSKPFSRSATQKFCTVTHGGDRGDRRGAVAARVTKTERQPPDIMAGPSSSIHPLPFLARGPTGKAVLALEVRSRTLHGHAPWTRTALRVCSAVASAANLNVISLS